MITAGQLQQIYALSTARAQQWAPHIASALALSECGSRQRVACWLAQIGHESGALRYTREIWGPTPQQRKYEPGTPLARRLGNTQPGDGHRYLGRGLIQTTGRANHAMTTARIREFVPDAPDFEADPEQLERMRWAALSAAVFWRVKKLNRYADDGNFAELTRRINGGHTGLAHRQALLTRALIVLQ